MEFVLVVSLSIQEEGEVAAAPARYRWSCRLKVDRATFSNTCHKSDTNYYPNLRVYRACCVLFYVSSTFLGSPGRCMTM